MFCRRINDDIVVSPDGTTEAFRFGGHEFAHISYASAWPGTDSLVVTAARGTEDCADVRENRRGNYRAYAVSSGGIAPLTKEYTNTAIPLPQQAGLVFSNGAALVMLSNGQRSAHKVGRFTWGAYAVSCNESGSRIAMTRWKGDSQKLAFVDVPTGTLTVSRFSYFSYLLMGDDILYVLSSDVMCYSHQSGKSRSLTPQSMSRALLDAVGLQQMPLPEAIISFGRLSLWEERPIMVASVQKAGTYERLWHGVMQVPYGEHPLKVILAVDAPWGVSDIASSGDTLALIQGRHEGSRLVEQRVAALGKHERAIMDGWWPVNHPRLPSTGFQFLPTT